MLISKIKAILVLFGLFLLSFLGPQETLAFTAPQSYYDWNTYIRESNVLGYEALAQEEGTDSAAVESPAPQDAPLSNAASYRQHKYFLSFASAFTPDNPFYYLTKKPEEFIATTFTFDPKKKEELMVELAGERLSEMEEMARKGKDAQVKFLTGSYNRTTVSITKQLNSLNEKGVDVAELASKVDLEFAKHTMVLEGVVLQAPPSAEQGLKKAISSSERVVDTIADVMGRPAVPAEVIQRLQALKAQGILSPEEVNKLVNVGSRREARDELRRYTEVRLFPESDFKKLDETARVYFPEDYYASVEIKKFRELKDLETQRPDEAVMAKVQAFADTYKPGEMVPTEIRRWWVPMVRLEELQNTIRPDLIPEGLFKYRPDDQQKFKEIVERVKPRPEDMDFVKKLAKTDPNILNDPAYARIVSIGNMFGMSSEPSVERRGPECRGNEHWVNVPYMPDGGYCVPNYDYPLRPDAAGNFPAVAACPAQFHRSGPDGPCYPDSQSGGMVGISEFAKGQKDNCSFGLHWTSTSSGGYCSPDYPRMGSGSFPGPVSTPAYCPRGMFFGPGGVCTSNDKSNDAFNCSQSGKYWDGASCQDQPPPPAAMPGMDGNPNPAMGNCRNPGECYDWCKANPGKCGGFNVDSPRPTEEQYQNMNTQYPPATGTYSSGGTGTTTGTTGTGTGTTGTTTSGCKAPSSGCPANSWFDWGSCSCRQSSATPPPYNGSSSYGQVNCAPPAQGCAGGQYWDGGTCSCKASSGTNYYQQPPSQTSQCGSGYYWNGSSCVSASAPPPSTQTPPPPMPEPVQTPSDTSAVPPAYPPPPTTTQIEPPPPNTVVEPVPETR